MLGFRPERKLVYLSMQWLSINTYKGLLGVVITFTVAADEEKLIDFVTSSHLVQII